MIREKLRSIKADPRRVSTGYALGIFLGTTPFVGCKVFMALILTTVFKWSKISAVFGVYHINLFTAPFFYTVSFFIGRSLMGTDYTFVYPEEVSAGEILKIFYGNLPVFYSLLVGGLMLGIPMATVAFFLAMNVTRSHRTLSGSGSPKLLPVSPPTAGPGYGEAVVLPRTPQPYTLITGASSGLGKEFAIECARRGRNLILVALPGRNLPLLCNVLERQFGVSAVCFETDLTDRNAIISMAGHLTRYYRIDFLINNAGTGGTLPFDTSTPEYLERIIHLNISAVALLTRLLIPELKRHRRSCILNVASMAAFSPIPFKTIYPASKAFIYNFSRSLNAELRGTGVSVAVVHPGPILTNPDVAIRIVRQGFAGRIGLLPASAIARAGLDGIAGGKVVIVPGFMNKFNRLLMKMVPSSVRLQTLARVIYREIEQERPLAA